MIDPRLAIHKKVATPDQCLKVNLGKVGKINRRSFVYDTSDPPQDEVLLKNPLLRFIEAEDWILEDDESERQGFEGFADYIYWIEEPKEKK